MNVERRFCAEVESPAGPAKVYIRAMNKTEVKRLVGKINGYMIKSIYPVVAAPLQIDELLAYIRSAEPRRSF